MRLEDKVVDRHRRRVRASARASPKRFAEEGARVMVNDVHAAGSERVAAAIRESGGAAESIRADVAIAADWAAMTQSDARRVRPHRHRREQRRLDPPQQAAASR